LSSEQYNPPFSLNSKIVALIAEICEALGRMSVLQPPQELRLRRINRIKTVHGSLAIEGNTLTEDQISAIIDGKTVVAPPREIQEARNAVKVYDQLLKWNPKTESDLLKAHEMLMVGLLDRPGQYRSKGAGVMGGDGEIMHIAPPANLVPNQMKKLFSWLRKTDAHPLVASCVFHYEFEFIHPFKDGNGRIGRLWQTLILSQWNQLFADLPVESMVHIHQQEYYTALNRSTSQASSAPFIEFMLETIIETISTPQVSHQVTPQVKKLLSVLGSDMSRQDIQAALKLKDRKSMRERYLIPALDANLIEMTVPDKPNSRLQKYRLTAKGKKVKGEV
jgi:cell filamentation protein, protein adenylyltransferase